MLALTVIFEFYNPNMKPFIVAIATFLIVTLTYAEMNQNLIDKLKQAYEQSLDDVIKELSQKKALDQQQAEKSDSTTSRSTRVITQPFDALHKRIIKSNRLDNGISSAFQRVESPLAKALERMSPLSFNANDDRNEPKVHVSGVVREIQSVTGPDGKTRFTESTHQINQSNLREMERKLPNLSGLFEDNAEQQGSGSIFSGLLGMPFNRDIEEEKPVVVIRRISAPDDNPLESLLGGLLDSDNINPQIMGRPLVKRRRRVVSHRTRRVVRKRVVHRRSVQPQEEELHPNIAHVANLYGNYLDNEIERHRNNIQYEDEPGYHHKVLSPKLITVREIERPSSEPSSPHFSLLKDENGQNDGFSISGTIRLGSDNSNPLELISEALNNLDNQDQQNNDSPLVQSIIPSNQNPVHIRVIGPVETDGQPIGSLFSNLLNHLEGNDIREEAPVVHHSTHLRHTVHHKRTVHRIQHAPAFNRPNVTSQVQSSPLQDLLDTLENNSDPSINETKPNVVIRRVSTPLLNDNYGKPLLYGASTFPTIGHGINRKEFSPVDFIHLLENDLPDPINQKRERGPLVHKRRSNRRRGRDDASATLTNGDLAELINGPLLNIARRKRNLSKYKA